MLRLHHALAVTLACVLTIAVCGPANADMLPCDPYEAACDNSLPLTTFYDPPTTGPTARAGDLLRTEPATEYTLDPGVTATRILYESSGPDGPVAVSAVVLEPSGAVPIDGWPVIAYAHGTSGTARLCAPSLMVDLYHGTQMSSLLRRGYAVVATDYAGLGGPGTHVPLSDEVLAKNVVDSVTAARGAVPTLSARWVAYGHSQGGLAVLGAAEIQHHDHDPGYLGTVATAPPTQVDDLVEQWAHNPYAAGFVALLAAAEHQDNPQIPLDEVLTPAALERLPLVRQSCLNNVLAAFSDLTGEALLQGGHITQPHLLHSLRQVTPGRRPVAGPILLLHGGADSFVPTSAAAALVADLCRTRSAAIEHHVYAGLEHDSYPGGPPGIDDGAMADLIDWIDARFAGAPAVDACRLANGEPARG